MTHRRAPRPATTRSTLPALAALSLAGALAQGCVGEALAQTPPTDAGVRRPPVPRPPPAPRPPPDGGMARVHPTMDPLAR